MIVFDLEATDLMKPGVAPLETQPRIIEFGAVKLEDGTLEEVDRLTFLINPGIPIPEEAVKITGITDAMVKGERPFVARFRELVDFFLGERVVAAHNAPYDCGVMEVELRRIDKLTLFPWPPERVCTVERTRHLTGKYMKLAALYEHIFETPPPHDRHRSMGDVASTVEIIRWGREMDLW